jgi:uncharacterized membrane protein
MPLWLIPMVYAAASIVCGFTLPRLEHAYWASGTFGISVASAQAFFSSVATGMIALTGIVFSIGLVMVQFSAVAYSPRMGLLFARDPMMFHSLGVFIATFFYSLATLLWIDREGTGIVPLWSGGVVVGLLVMSMIFFAQLVKRLSDVQITSVLHVIGNIGRKVIREMSERLDEKQDGDIKSESGSDAVPASDLAARTLKYFGQPRTIASFDIDRLVRLGQRAEGVIVLACAVGDTIFENTTLLRVHGAKYPPSERDLRRTIHLELGRTSEQDPKYPIRLLVDIAIRALSPAINDPTTAVQAIDQIEDLLRRLGQRELGAGHARDANGVLRLVFPMPTWDDYLTLAFDEIRQYGGGSVQVMRRLRSALVGLADSVGAEARVDTVRRYLTHLDVAIGQSSLDADDQEMARAEDRQGLGLSGRRVGGKNSPH